MATRLSAVAKDDAVLLRPAAFLFDQDGTLIDSEPLWLEAESSLVASVGAYLDEATHARIVGSPLSETVNLLMSIADLAMTPEQVGDAIVGRMEQALTGHVPWIDGARELLVAAQRWEVPTALVTSSYRRLADAVNADHPAGGFAVVITGDQGLKPKPNPESYLSAARQLHVPIEDCLVVEDSPRGVEAGLACGAHVVAIPCVTQVPPMPGLSRLKTLRQLTPVVIDQILRGTAIDLLR